MFSRQKRSRMQWQVCERALFIFNVFLLGVLREPRKELPVCKLNKWGGVQDGNFVLVFFVPFSFRSRNKVATGTLSSWKGWHIRRLITPICQTGRSFSVLCDEENGNLGVNCQYIYLRIYIYFFFLRAVFLLLNQWSFNFTVKIKKQS